MRMLDLAWHQTARILVWKSRTYKQIDSKSKQDEDKQRLSARWTPC